MEPPAPLAVAGSYASPAATCDVVMRGGVTSGVVYPWAVCELARHYRLVRVGGTSAGAVAAAASAAAEHGRHGGASGRGGFPVLARLPGDLASARRGRSRLSTLFAPQRATAPLLRLLLAVLAAREAGSLAARARATLTGVGAAAVAPGGWWRLLLGALPGLVLLAVAAAGGASAATAVLVAVVGVLVLLAGTAAGAAAVHLRALRVAVPANLYGVCSGMPSGDAPDDDRDDDRVLAPWLTDLLDEAAGLPEGAGPLTFGHLWAGPGAEPLTGLEEAPADAAVRLEVVTTSVTHGRPVRMPLGARRDGVPPLYVDPAELRRLLPERVVAWVEEHPPPLPEDPAERLERRARDALARPLVPLPASADLPVALAVRTSLSYPLLVSAVPFHVLDLEEGAGALRRVAAAVDDVLSSATSSRSSGAPGSEPGEEDPLGAVLVRLPGEVLPTRRVWTTDGGVTSNFPVQVFDAFAPSRPTFGITLRPQRPGSPMGGPLDPGAPGPADDALAPVLHPLEPGADGSPAGVLRFAGAVLSTMQDWSDTVQLPLPGVRDRVAQVEVPSGDGGWDLRMPPEAIARLAGRGREAGVALRERFTTAGASGWTGWETHRWTRLRASLPLLEEAAGELVAALDPATAGPGEQDLREMLRLPPEEVPVHPWTGRSQRRRAQQALAGLLESSPAGVPPEDRLGAGAPQPPLALRYGPRDGV
ncbi:hypothetical protein WDZ16_02385 [Pseudokineococcus marinus]